MNLVVTPSCYGAEEAPCMTITITDEIFATADRLLRLPTAEWRSQLHQVRQILWSRAAEPEFVPDQHARAHALIDEITAALGDGPATSSLCRNLKNTI